MISDMAMRHRRIAVCRTQPAGRSWPGKFLSACRSPVFVRVHSSGA